MQLSPLEKGRASGRAATKLGQVPLQTKSPVAVASSAESRRMTTLSRSCGLTSRSLALRLGDFLEQGVGRAGQLH